MPVRPPEAKPNPADPLSNPPTFSEVTPRDMPTPLPNDPPPEEPRVEQVHARFAERGWPLPDRRTVKARVDAIDRRGRGPKRPGRPGGEGTPAAPGGAGRVRCPAAPRDRANRPAPG